METDQDHLPMETDQEYHPMEIDQEHLQLSDPKVIFSQFPADPQRLPGLQNLSF